MREYLHYIASVLLLTLSACSDFLEQEVDINKLPPINSKLAIFGQFDRDSTFFVALTQSYVIGDKKQPNYTVPNAKVYIYVDGDTIQLTETKNYTLISNRGFNYYDSGEGNTDYSTNKFSFYANSAYTFKPGKNYAIAVEGNGKTASATTFIPDTVARIEANLTTSYYDPQLKQISKGKHYTAQLSWDTDPISANNYYAIELLCKIKRPFINVYTDSQGNPVYFTDTFTTIDRPEVFFDDLGIFNYIGGSTYFVSPAKQNGSRMRASIIFRSVNYYSSGSNGLQTDSIIEVTAKINKVTKELADFHQTYYNYERSHGNPFAEAVRIKSNVSTGLGYVSGLSTQKINLKMP